MIATKIVATIYQRRLFGFWSKFIRVSFGLSVYKKVLGESAQGAVTLIAEANMPDFAASGV